MKHAMFDVLLFQDYMNHAVFDIKLFHDCVCHVFDVPLFQDCIIHVLFGASFQHCISHTVWFTITSGLYQSHFAFTNTIILEFYKPCSGWCTIISGLYQPCSVWCTIISGLYQSCVHFISGCSPANHERSQKMAGNRQWSQQSRRQAELTAWGSDQRDNRPDRVDGKI